MQPTIVRNVREGWKDRYPDVTLRLSDMQVWAIFDEWSLVDSDTDDKEQPIFDALYEANEVAA